MLVTPRPSSTEPSVLSAVAPGARGARFVLSDVLSALSYALDLTEGQRPGHTIRSCIIGMRLGAEAGLAPHELSALYFALLLKDAGCSSNAARMAALFGSSDRDVKYRMRLVDWHAPVRLALETARSCGIGHGLSDRLRHFVTVARTDHVTRDLTQVRCDRGADIAVRLGFPVATGEAIRSLDEHWSGRGYPAGQRADEIPLLARIACLAQALEAFWSSWGVDEALHVARRRRGRWFDPRLVDLVLGWRHDRAWWERLGRQAEIGAAVLALEPGGDARLIDDDELDGVAAAFADIIDAKSPYTARHSSNVAAYALEMARELGLDDTVRRSLFRAALLHDVGKLGISSGILDKSAPLTADERLEVERHPRFTWEILQRVSAFSDFAWVAAVHHEKLDGTGYPWRLTGAQLDMPARILAVADIYEALRADRPYRAGMPPERAMEILRAQNGTALCPQAVGAVEALVRRDDHQRS